ncbi:MAG: hypothetical protein ABIK89_13605 [Planctomycetota bacterium]
MSLQSSPFGEGQEARVQQLAAQVSEPDGADAMEELGSMGAVAESAIPALLEQLDVASNKPTEYNFFDLRHRAKAAKAIACIHCRADVVVSALIEAIVKEERRFRSLSLVDSMGKDMTAYYQFTLACQIEEYIIALAAFGAEASDAVPIIQDAWRRLGATPRMVHNQNDLVDATRVARSHCSNVRDALQKITGSATSYIEPEGSATPAWPTVCADCGLPDPRDQYQESPSGRRRCRKCSQRLGALMDG